MVNTRRSGFHGQVDFCGHPLLILFGQDGGDQAQAAGSVGEQPGDSRSSFDLLVQSLQPVGRTHGARVFRRQCKRPKALGQIRLVPSRKFGMRAAPALYCQAKQPGCFVGVGRIEIERIVRNTGTR